MRQIRLFLDTPLTVGCTTRLPETAARHALRVLRLANGDRVVAFNGDGQEYPAQLCVDDPRHPALRIESVCSPDRESPLTVTLVQALVRGEKMDWIIQKATELGVAAIAPIATERNEVKLDAARAGTRLAHWRAIVRAACEQCGRNRIPHVAAPATLHAWLADAAPAALNAAWVLQPGGPRRLRELPALPSAITLAAGPEGGFSDDDLATLHAAGFVALALGPRILRAETAGMAALAALQAMYGDG